MDTRTSGEYFHLIYDPILHGYTTSFFKTNSGTPAISTNYLRLNAAETFTTGQFMYGDFDFKLTIPAVSAASLIMGAAGTTDITVWDQITDGEFAVTLDGDDYDITGLDFSGGTYTPALLTGGNAATSTIATWAAVTDGSFSVDIDGVTADVTGIDFSNVAAYTPAFLTGGNAATNDFATWAAVTDGEFTFTIDGVATDVTAIDFTGVTTMGEVAAVLQTAIRAETTGLETVEWDTNHFVITSGDTTSASAITVLSATGGAGTDISGAGATTFLDAEVAVGVVTNKVSTMTMDEVAATIQTALQTETGSTETVVWDTDHFIISSVNTTSTSAITVTSAVGSGTDLSGAGGTAFLDSDTGHGTVSARAMTDAMDWVASVIEAAVIGFTNEDDNVVYDTDHFVLSSGTTEGVSSVTVLSAVSGGSGTDISGAGYLNGLTGTGVVTTGTVKSFGLQSPCMSAINYILFDIVGDKVLCKTCDSDGVVNFETVDWNTAWSAASTKFSIRWSVQKVIFLINDIIVATLAENIVKDVSLPVKLSNSDSNNMDLAYLFFKGISKANNEMSPTLKNLEDVIEIDGSGNEAIRTTATISGDVNVDSNSVGGGMMIGKVSGGDFNTAYSAATAIACTNLPTAHATLLDDDIVSVVQINASGTVVNTYTRDDKAMAVAGNVITVTGASFSASDLFVVYTNVNILATDVNASAIKTATEASATDLAAIEVLETAGNVLLTTIDADTDDIKTVLEDVHDNPANLLRTAEQDPLNYAFQAEKVAAVTNGTDGTYTYYVDLATFRKGAIQLLLDSGSGSVTVTVEGSCQDDGTAPASCTYVDITNALFGSATFTTSNILFDKEGYFAGLKYLKIKVIADTTGANNADWTIFVNKVW